MFKFRPPNSCEIEPNMFCCDLKLATFFIRFVIYHRMYILHQWIWFKSRMVDFYFHSEGPIALSKLFRFRNKPINFSKMGCNPNWSNMTQVNADAPNQSLMLIVNGLWLVLPAIFGSCIWFKYNYHPQTKFKSFCTQGGTVDFPAYITGHMTWEVRIQGSPPSWETCDIVRYG